jgi:hypothetical protein
LISLVKNDVPSLNRKTRPRQAQLAAPGHARAQTGAAVERRIHAAADPRDLTSCRINPAFLLPERHDWTFRSIKVRPPGFPATRD